MEWDIEKREQKLYVGATVPTTQVP